MGTFSIKGAISVSSSSAPTTPSWGGGTSGADPTRPLDNASLLAGINSLVKNNPSLYCGWVAGAVGFHPGNWAIRFGFDLSSNLISLDGGAAVSWNNLPLGAYAQSAQLRIKVLGGPAWGLDPGSTLFFQTNPLTESANLGPVASDTTAVTKTFNYPSLNLSFLNILLDGFGIKFVTTLGGAEGQTFYAVEITGTYSILSYTQPVIDGVHYPEKQTTLDPRSFIIGIGGGGTGTSGSTIAGTIPPGSRSPGYTFPPLIVDPSLTTNGGTLIPPSIGTDAAPIYITAPNMIVAGKITPGDIIRGTSLFPVSGSLDLSEITEIQLTWVDSLGDTITFILPIFFWFYFTPTVIIFQIPPYIEIKLNDPTIPGWPIIPITPVVQIVGTTFSGRVALNPLKITLADASGIYALVADKTNDTVYDNVNPPDTTDVKIPDPFIKTGFIGG